MQAEPLQALRANSRPVPRNAPPGLVIAGATGVLGTEVLRRLAGSQRYGPARVLAREPFTDGMRDVATLLVPSDDPGQWPPLAASTGVVLFEPPRMFHGRERALWTPSPEQLVKVAAWMRAGGATTLAVVLPHAQGSLPEALKRGLATLDEQAVASLGFERLLFIRSAQKPGQVRHANLLHRLAHAMLSIARVMVPSSEQPVRAAKVAELVALALQLAPPGIHVAAPEMVWRASQGSMRDVTQAWLAR